MTHSCTHIVVVEWDRLRAERFLAAFRVAVVGRRELLLDGQLATGEGGDIGLASASVYALCAKASAAAAGEPSIVDHLGDERVAGLVVERLKKVDRATFLGAADVTLAQPPVRNRRRCGSRCSRTRAVDRSASRRSRAPQLFQSARSRPIRS
jgi:hypothetical protein